jgi:hypothetical protein
MDSNDRRRNLTQLCQVLFQTYQAAFHLRFLKDNELGGLSNTAKFIFESFTLDALLAAFREKLVEASICPCVRDLITAFKFILNLFQGSLNVK